MNEERKSWLRYYYVVLKQYNSYRRYLLKNHKRDWRHVLQEVRCRHAAKAIIRLRRGDEIVIGSTYFPHSSIKEVSV
jgi:hypothetical protein